MITKNMKVIAEYIKKMHLKWCDLFILFGFLFALPTIIERNSLVTISNPTQTTIPFVLIVISFVLTIACLVTYLVLERKEKYVRVHPAVLIFFAVIIITMTISIFVQPNEITTTVFIQNPNQGIVGDPITVTTNISSQVKIVSLFSIILLLIGVYLGIWLLPNKIKTIAVVEPTCFAFFAFLGIAIIFSYIAEFNNYIQLFKNLFTLSNLNNIDIYAPKSFLYHRNIYGTFLMFGVFASLMCYQFKKRKIYIFMLIFLALNLLLTIYKGGIIFTAVGLVAYEVYCAITKLKEDKKKGTRNLIIIGSIVIGLGLLLLILYLASGTIREKIDSLFKGGYTLTTRINIWKTTLILLKPAWWLIGRGGWIFNNILRNCNIAAQGDYTGSTHNAFLSLIAVGGLSLLIGFITLAVYAIKDCFKIYKNNKGVASVLIIATFVFILNLIIEASYYIPLITFVAISFISKVDNMSESLKASEKNN